MNIGRNCWWQWWNLIDCNKVDGFKWSSFSTCEDKIIKSTFRPYWKSPSSNLSLNDCLCICMCVWMCVRVWISDHDPNVATWLKYGPSLFDVEHDPISFLFIFVKRVVFWDQRINWVFKSWKYNLSWLSTYQVIYTHIVLLLFLGIQIFWLFSSL